MPRMKRSTKIIPEVALLNIEEAFFLFLMKKPMNAPEASESSIYSMISLKSIIHPLYIGREKLWQYRLEAVLSGCNRPDNLYRKRYKITRMCRVRTSI
mgnify:CR=1 FL=1